MGRGLLANPLGLSHQQYVAHLKQVVQDMDIPLTRGNEHWKEWSRNLILLNPAVDLPFPSEQGYKEEEWTKYAVRLYQQFQNKE